MYFIIKIVILFLLLQTHTVIHELGHVFAINISKEILQWKIKRKVKFKTKVCLINGSGRTESYLYEYIAYLKYRHLIKFNAIAGILTEIVVYSSIIVSLLYYNRKVDNTLCLNIIVLYGMLLLSRVFQVIPFKCNINNNYDIIYFYYPEKFKYKYNHAFINKGSNLFKLLFMQADTYIYCLASIIVHYIYLHFC